MSYAKLVCVFLLFFINLNTIHCFRTGCKDENGQAVDWYVNYKFPQLEKGYDGTLIEEGTGYAHMSSARHSQWVMSQYSIRSENSMLARTLQPVIDNKKNTTYLFYNDEPASGYNGTSNGHLKGIVAFDENSGFWIIHSIPKFGRISEYFYPPNALEYGQSVLCVTFRTSALNEICKQLLHCKPMVYEKQVTNAVLPLLDTISRTLFSSKPAFNKNPPFKRIVPLKSIAQDVFLSFAKDGKLEEDIYSTVIATTLKSDLATETWRRGKGGNLPATCNTVYKITDIAEIKMSALNGTRNADIIFSSRDDHSKWAVSSNPRQLWICIGDMNRMASQAHRGGGAMCFENPFIAKAYQALISDSDHCPS